MGRAILFLINNLKLAFFYWSLIAGYIKFVEKTDINYFVLFFLIFFITLSINILLFWKISVIAKNTTQIFRKIDNYQNVSETDTSCWNIKELEEKSYKLGKIYKETIDSNNIVMAELSKTNKLINNLLDINFKILDERDIKTFFNYILKKIIDSVEIADYGSFMKYENGYMVYLTYVGFPKDIEKVKIKLEDTFLYVKTNGKMNRPVLIDNVLEFNFDKLDKESKEIINMTSVKANKSISAPILIDGKLYGMINIDSSKKRDFEAKDVRVMAYYSESIALAIKNRLFIDDILFLSNYDSLTEIFNRRHFEELVRKTLDGSNNGEEAFALVVFDLNNLKNVNDILGHDSGDALIKGFACHVRNNLKISDIFGRIGGDEFALLLKNEAPEFAEKEIEKLSKDIEASNAKNKIKISFSYGISYYPKEGTLYEDIFKVADDRMYQNKKSHKEKVNKNI